MVAKAEALLLLLSLKSVVAILPPTNVTVKCHNFENVVYWNYSASDQLAHFAVNISRYVRSPHEINGCSNTTKHHCNISSKTREVEEHYFVSVTAMVGSNVSEPADSAQFSYYVLFDGQHCSLDFPHVDVSMKQDNMVLSFKHPFYFYRKTLKHVSNKDEYKDFVFHILFENTSDPMTFSCNTKPLCEEVIPVSREVHAFTIWGLMNNINLRTSKDISDSREEKRTYPVFYIIAGVCVVVFFVIGIIICMLVYRRQTYPSSLPKTVASVLTNPRRGTGIIIPARENTMLIKSIESPSIDSPSSDTAMLLHSQDPKQDVNPGDARDCSRFPLGPGDDASGSSCSSESESKTEASGGEQDVSEVFTSGYDRPKLMGVEMSPDDTVIGYRD